MISNVSKYVRMLRKWAATVILPLYCGGLFAAEEVELEVVFPDDAAQCRFLYVLAETGGDTLAVFDTLSFGRQRRSSLFFPMPRRQSVKLVAVTAGGRHLESRPARVSSHRTTFLATVGDDAIHLSVKDFLYPRKNDSEQAYLVFLLIFFAVKLSLAALFAVVFRLPKTALYAVCGMFMISGLIEWNLPLDYLLRMLVLIALEWIFISIGARKIISPRQTLAMVTTVNIAAFGLIAAVYLAYVFR
ncbi:MAG: hypothetical protein LBR08_12235 [Bacteroidales bacterium]|jgi:hypothetical protein|nr:hypothetical protein [Bacteroidales bacterium]